MFINNKRYRFTTEPISLDASAGLMPSSAGPGFNVKASLLILASGCSGGIMGTEAERTEVNHWGNNL